MKITTRYYDENADKYYHETINSDVSDVMKRFLAYLPECGTIVDAGSGSGRDVKKFCDMGFDARGIDSSKELVKLSRERLGIDASLQDMSNWKEDEPVDGIWCCASLMHLADRDIRLFLSNARTNLKKGGVLFISVKTGVRTGLDKTGRYIRNFSEEEMKRFIYDTEFLSVAECWYTNDVLGRHDFQWLNVISTRK